MEKWIPLPMSIQAHVSVIKIIVLPRINFVSSMLPLSPPSDAVSKFIWKGKKLNLR